MIRRALIAAIVRYRRHLSGRGPLRAVRCTFAQGESCSAYGLRAAREAPTVGRAVGRIRRRLRRCRDASVYVHTAAGTRSLAWNAELVRPLDELIAELETDAELPPARAKVLAAREVVARWRGDLFDRVAIAAHRHALPAADACVRPAPTRRSLLARRIRRALLAFPALFALAYWLLPVSAPLALAAVSGVLVFAVTRPSVRLARHARQARAAALQRGAVATG